MYVRCRNSLCLCVCVVQECLMKMREVLEEEKKDVRFGTWSSGDVRGREGVREEGSEGVRERGRRGVREGGREGGREERNEGGGE